MKPTTIGFIGGGRITRIFLQGYQNKSFEFSSIKIYDHDPEKVKLLLDEFPEAEVAETVADAAKAKVVVLALHPPVLNEMLDKIAPEIDEQTFIVSLAPSITISRITEIIKVANIIRAIPNAASIINKGFIPVTFHDAMLKKEKKFIKKLFKPLGKTIVVEEYKLEGYAVISGMLPACFWFQIQEMEHIAAQTGLSPEEAQKAISSSLKRTVDVYFKSGLTPTEVMDLVPVKPLADKEEEISNTLNSRLLSIYTTIKPH